ncbi:MAG: GMP reductase [Alphaproteobacteria bacterium]|nr:GMP reductase [Alphaproteobacteria bacterium]HCQ71736.1 GMP reductase [Rhodospirillaceae bacterium]|tara:strand:- start:8487 stop:9548 length:1062 start_codon:yes stop_codon:yes gene_type:complete
MRIEEDVKLDFKDVLIRPKRSTLASRKEVDIKRAYTFKWSKRTYEGVPIIAANMDNVGTMDMARAFIKDGNGLTVALHKHYPLETLIDFFSEYGGSSVWYSIGLVQDDRDKLKAFLESAPQKEGKGIDKICIDVANGYSESFLDYIKGIRDMIPDDITLMAGNVVTGEIVEELILAGIDIVKVGIGPGSVCTTRKMTGVGYPQLSAIIECADAAHGLGGRICGDGGCTVPGDVSKAFAGGSDFVMLGGMLAGHDESEQEIVTGDDGEKYLAFYGMSSDTAMKKHKGGVAEYRASEGKTVKIPYRGPVEGTLQDILGGVRSTCTYVGARQLKELTKRTTFVRVTQQINNIFGAG